jgi:hypothetical protein
MLARIDLANHSSNLRHCKLVTTSSTKTKLNPSSHVLKKFVVKIPKRSENLKVSKNYKMNGSTFVANVLQVGKVKKLCTDSG